MKSKYTIREFRPIDGYFALIEKDGLMIAKAFNPEDAKKIASALELFDKSNGVCCAI